MRTIGMVMLTLVGVLLVGALGYAGITAIRYLGSISSSLDLPPTQLVVIGSVVALFCALIISGALKTSIRHAVSKDTANLYLCLLAAWGKRAKDGAKGSEEKAEFDELEGGLALYGSPRVISAHLALRRAKEQSSDELNELFGKLALEMRTELRGTRDWLDKNQLRDLLLNRHREAE